VGGKKTTHGECEPTIKNKTEKEKKDAGKKRWEKAEVEGEKIDSPRIWKTK
jgi:hypothetical protein